MLRPVRVEEALRRKIADLRGSDRNDDRPGFIGRVNDVAI
jgi:hypothetical protein